MGVNCKMLKTNSKKNIIKIILIIVLIIFFIILKNICELWLVKKERGFVYGKKNASIVIEEYSSFECGSCKDFHLENKDVLKKYITTGVVKYILKPVDIERFEYDDYIYTHLSNKEIKKLDYINRIFETQYEWINFENVEQLNEFLKLESEKNKYFNDDFIWKKEELLDKKISIVPHIKLNGEILDSKITRDELTKKIELIIKQKEN